MTVIQLTPWQTEAYRRLSVKLGRVLDELRVTVRDLGQETVPILTELQGTVRATNEELGKLSLVTADVAKVSANATLVSDNAAQLSGIVNATVAKPLVKTAALGHGLDDFLLAGAESVEAPNLPQQVPRHQ